MSALTREFNGTVDDYAPLEPPKPFGCADYYGCDDPRACEANGKCSFKHVLPDPATPPDAMGE